MRATFSARRRDKLSAETREALSTEISRGLEFLKYESLEGMGRNWPILVTNKLGGAAVNRQSRAQPTEVYYYNVQRRSDRWFPTPSEARRLLSTSTSTSACKAERN